MGGKADWIFLDELRDLYLLSRPVTIHACILFSFSSISPPPPPPLSLSLSLSLPSSPPSLINTYMHACVRACVQVTHTPLQIDETALRHYATTVHHSIRLLVRYLQCCTTALDQGTTLPRYTTALDHDATVHYSTNTTVLHYSTTLQHYTTALHYSTGLLFQHASSAVGQLYSCLPATPLAEWYRTVGCFTVWYILHRQ